MRIGVVLAAGSSTRMGRPKLELPVGERPMLRRVVDTMRKASFDRIRVVTAPGARPDLPEDPRLEVVENPSPGEGIASSIRKGIEDLPADTELVAIALGDLPLVREETVAELLRAYDETGSAIVYPEYRGQQGHPVLWHRSLLEELRGLEGDRGAKPILERHRDLVLALPVEDPGVCIDIDTPDDYRALQDSHRSRHT